MKQIDMKYIRSLGPCYDPIKHISEDWTGTAVDLLKMDGVPFLDRLWVVLRTDLVSEKCMRLFAVWSARQVQHLMTDPRSIAALDIAERFANGEATNEELLAARDAACAAAWAATWDAERDAAWAATWDAERDAACAAAWAVQTKERWRIWRHFL